MPNDSLPRPIARYVWPGFERDGLPALPEHGGVYLMTFETADGFVVYTPGEADNFRRRFAQAPGRLHVRVGVETGIVVVGDLIGTGEAQERGIVGETPNLAARLQALAEPDSLVVGPRTRLVLGDMFDYRDLGELQVKGLDRPVHAYEVVGLSAVESRFEALHATDLTRLIGRDEEIDLLIRRWERAKRGSGQVVLISGEPGIGKSRLAASVVERIGAAPYTRLRYFCSPHHADSAFYPIISQLERAADFKHDDDAHVKADKLDTLLAQATKATAEDSRLFADLLLLPDVGRTRHSPLVRSNANSGRLMHFCGNLTAWHTGNLYCRSSRMRTGLIQQPSRRWIGRSSSSGGCRCYSS